MFAIVEIAGLQYKVEQDQKLFVNRLTGEKGTKMSFDKVLLTQNGTTTIGAPAVKGITVNAEILEHLKADKVIVFKKKRRKGYEKKNGHRQSLTQIVITGITGFDAPKKATKAKPVAEIAVAKAPVVDSTSKTAEEIDRQTVDFSQDHELNYHLKKNSLSQTKENRQTLISLGNVLQTELNKELLSHEDVDGLIAKNIGQFKSTTK